MSGRQTLKNVNKYIEIEQCSDVDMANMTNDLKPILNSLNTDPSSDPNKNYNLFTKTIIELKNKYITKKWV